MSDANDRMAERIREVFRDWADLLAEVLREAEEAGELKVKARPEVLARHTIATIEGGIMMARLSKNGDHLRDCLNSLRILLGIEAE